MPLLRLFSALLLAALLPATSFAAEPYFPASPVSAAAIAKALSAPIVTIVDKPQPSPTGNAHDYVSYARYWWPDPSKPDGLPYLQHDGKHNEKQVQLGDEPRMFAMNGAVYALARGWVQTKDPADAKRAGEWLRAWFVTPATRMNPNLEYSQIQLGHNHNHGNGTGVLDGRSLAESVDAVRMLEGSPALTPDEAQAVHAWFGEYSQWLETSPNGRKEHNAPNNHGTWFLAQAIPIARFAGDDALAKQLCEGDRARIDHQFKPDGSQPEELRREDGLGYSIFNLTAQFKVATYAAALGIDLWHYTSPSGGSLQQGLAYLQPYNANPKSWPGKELKAVKPGFLDELIAQGAAAWSKPGL